MGHHHKHSHGNRFAQFLGIGAAGALGFIGLVSFYALFPGPGIVLAIGIGASILISERRVFGEDVDTAFKTLFTGGVFHIPRNLTRSLAKRMALREITHFSEALAHKPNAKLKNSTDPAEQKIYQKQMEAYADWREEQAALIDRYWDQSTGGSEAQLYEAFLKNVQRESEKNKVLFVLPIALRIYGNRLSLSFLYDSLPPDVSLSTALQDPALLKITLENWQENNPDKSLFDAIKESGDWREVEYVLIFRELTRRLIQQESLPASLEDLYQEFNRQKKFLSFANGLNDQFESELPTFIFQWQARHPEQSLLKELGLAHQLETPDLYNIFLRKKRLLFASVIFSIIYGAAFGLLTYSSVFSALETLVALGIITSAATTMIAVSGGFAVIGFMAFALLTYKMLDDAVLDEIHQQSARLLKSLFKKPKSWLILNYKEKFYYLLRASLKAVLVFIFIAVSILVALATSGTYFQGILETLRAAEPAAEIAATIFTHALTWLIVLPLGLMFAMEHSSNSVKKLLGFVSSIAHGIVKECQHFKTWHSASLRFADYGKAISDRVVAMKNLSATHGKWFPVKAFFAALYVLISFVAFVCHLAGEGSIAGHNSKNAFSLLVEKTFESLGNFFSTPINPQISITTCSTLQSGLTDGDYLFPEPEAEIVSSLGNKTRASHLDTVLNNFNVDLDPADESEEESEHHHGVTFDDAMESIENTIESVNQFFSRFSNNPENLSDTQTLVASQNTSTAQALNLLGGSQSSDTQVMQEQALYQRLFARAPSRPALKTSEDFSYTPSASLFPSL